MKYKAILADPPWTFKVWSDKGKGRSAERHYPVMSLYDIKNLPVRELADEESILFLWVIGPMIPQGLEVMKAWGFDFKTIAFSWAKLNKSGGPWMGLGYWTRANIELCLLGTRGTPKRKYGGVRQLILSERRAHSQKPEEQYARIELLVDGPYLELFARRRHNGWHSWGNEIQSDIDVLKLSEGEYTGVYR